MSIAHLDDHRPDAGGFEGANSMTTTAGKAFLREALILCHWHHRPHLTEVAMQAVRGRAALSPRDRAK